MSYRDCLALLAKDIRLHGRDIALVQGGILALLGLASWLRPTGAASLGSLAFNLNLIAALVWGEWLISREKSKGTFAWLRSMPIDDRVLVAEKFIANAACCALLWTASSVLFARGEISGYGFATWSALLLALLAFGAMSVAARWRFRQKLGQVLPAILVIVPLALFVIGNRTGTGLTRSIVESWRTDGGKLITAAALAGLYGGTFAITLAWVRRADTYQLLE